MPASVNLNRSEPRESPATPFPMPERRSTDRQTQLYSGGRREEGKEDQKPPRMERDGLVVKSAKRLRALTCPSSRSGHLGQDFLHLGGCESTHCPRADVTQHVRRQQHAGSRLVVRRVEDAHLVILTKCPIHLVNTHPHGLHFGAPVGHPLGRFLSGLDALISELHQTNVRRHDVPPSGSPRIGFRNEDKINLCLPIRSVKRGEITYYWKCL